MDGSARLAQLLGRMRRERNGAVADAMRCYGKPCGLNYGVSLPTVRSIARDEGHDPAFAQLLWQQDVRELRLAALHIADPARLTPGEARSWAAGISNSELAEEAAFALLRRSPHFGAIFAEWIAGNEPLLVYAALLGAARTEQPDAAWLQPAVDAVQRASGPYARLIAQGAVAFLEALGRQNEAGRQAVLRAVDPLDPSVREEVLWRLAE